MRLDEAQHLLAAGHAAGAYYLAGYAVELALKAVIAGQFRANEIPEWAMAPIRVHRPENLMRLAGLHLDRDRRRTTSATFDRHWEVVEAWSVDARYRTDLTQESAQALVDAVADQTDGVLTWIRTRW